MSDPRRPIFDAVKAARRGASFKTPEVAILDNALDALGVPRAGKPLPTPKPDPIPAPAPVAAADPDWLAHARTLMGTKEIVGPQHNSWIVKQWAKLGASWFNDDETPWCGLFVAACMQAVGLPFPGKGQFARALAWKDWGKPCGILLGAVAVFGRQGGGHVGFIVGESADMLYILGGNQSNAVNIMPIAKSRLVASRWPAERAVGTAKPPKMSGGTVSVNER